MAVDVDANATLAAMRAGIYQEVGIAAKQQRLIILGEGPASRLGCSLPNVFLLPILQGNTTVDCSEQHLVP